MPQIYCSRWMKDIKSQPFKRKRKNEKKKWLLIIFPLSPFSRLFPLFLPVLPILSPSQPPFSRFSPLLSFIAECFLLHGWLCLVLSSPHSSIGDYLLLHSRLCPHALISTHPWQLGRVSSFFFSSFKECPVQIHHQPASTITTLSQSLLTISSSSKTHLKQLRNKLKANLKTRVYSKKKKRKPYLRKKAKHWRRR